MIKKTTTLTDTDTKISLKELPTGNLEIKNCRPSRFSEGQDGSFNFSNSKPETILKVCQSIINLVDVAKKESKEIRVHTSVRVKDACCITKGHDAYCPDCWDSCPQCK